MIKKTIAAGLTALFLTVLPAHAGKTEVLVDQQEPAAMKCFVSCPGPGGFPGVPQVTDCTDMPEIGRECSLIIRIISRKNLENAIRNLRGLTGGDTDGN